MMIGSTAVSSSARSRRHTSYPSRSGMTTSRRTRSGLSDATSSSAERPFVAEATSYPREDSTASSSRTFSGMSSTTRIFGSPLLPIGCLFAVCPDRLDQLHHVDRFREVAVETGFDEPLTIAVHGLRGQCHDWNRCGAFIRTETAERYDAVDVGQLDVHQHQVRCVLHRELDRPLPGCCLERPVARRLQDVAEELHVLVVVLDDEDLRARHDATPAGSENVNVLPWPGSLSTQMRPPWSSTRRFDNASPRPVPSRCPAPASVCWNSSKIRS